MIHIIFFQGSPLLLTAFNFLHYISSIRLDLKLIIPVKGCHVTILFCRLRENSLRRTVSSREDLKLQSEKLFSLISIHFLISQQCLFYHLSPYSIFPFFLFFLLYPLLKHHLSASISRSLLLKSFLSKYFPNFLNSKSLHSIFLIFPLLKHHFQQHVIHFSIAETPLSATCHLSFHC